MAGPPTWPVLVRREAAAGEMALEGPIRLAVFEVDKVTGAKRLFRKRLSGRDLNDFSRLSRPSWRYHVDPDHPHAA